MKRDRQIKTRISLSEEKTIDRAAKKLGLARSEYLRSAALEKAAEPGRGSYEKRISEQTAALLEVKKLLREVIDRGQSVISEQTAQRLVAQAEQWTRAVFETKVGALEAAEAERDLRKQPED